MISNEEQEQLLKVVKSSAEKMKGSGTFISLFTHHYEKDPACLMQLSLAILMDKPMLFLVPNGQVLPEKLKKIADDWEYYDPKERDSIHEATMKMLNRKGVVT